MCIQQPSNTILMRRYILHWYLFNLTSSESRFIESTHRQDGFILYTEGRLNRYFEWEIGIKSIVKDVNTAKLQSTQLVSVSPAKNSDLY